MTAAFLHYASSERSPEMRHEIAVAVADPVVFLEVDGRRVVAASRLEASLFAARDDVVDEFWSYDDLGYAELIADDSVPTHLIGPELVIRAARRAGVGRVVVPESFPVLVADALRGAGVTVEVDPPAWSGRRRRKAPWELEGIERAQRAAEVAMLTAARMLRSAEPTARGELRFEGEILTSELVREAMSSALAGQGAEATEILVQGGDACLSGHDPGTGPLRPGESIVIDVFPRDRRTGTHSDMTRTFVVGEPSARLKELHADCRAALELALDGVRPGADDLWRKVAGFFEERGHPTWLGRSPSQGPPNEGFVHALGHGVGLEVHERPLLGVRSDPLVAGDVIALEPGLYYPGVGGVRLEDTVVVTDDGFERLTDPFPYDLEVGA